MEDRRETVELHYAEPMFGVQVGRVKVKVHPESDCAGPVGENGRPICCIHNPTNHHMRDWTQNYRGDRGLMERLCSHGVGHPDPDDLSIVMKVKHAGVHGCDGCCRAPASDEPETYSL